MSRAFRSLLIGIGIGQAVFAAVFALQLPLAVGLWPFPDTTPMTYILVASFFAAAGVSTGWCAWKNEAGALVGIALDYLAIFAPLVIFAFQVSGSIGSNALTVFAIACAG